MSSSPISTSSPRNYSILHTNDFHNVLSETQADKLKILKQQVGNRGLLVDAGDAISAGNITFKPGGEPILDMMNSIGYDAMTVGNREFHFSRVGFHSKLSRANFPILSANVRTVHGKSIENNGVTGDGDDDFSNPLDPPVIPWKRFVLEDGFTVIIFGVTVPMITEKMLVRRVSSYVFDDPVSTAVRLAARLKQDQNPDMIIALTHIGDRRDRELAEKTSDIDLIIGGHTHVIMEDGMRIGNTLIVQAGSHGRKFGVVDVSFIKGQALEMLARLGDL